MQLIDRDEIIFSEEDHTYTMRGKHYISVTGVFKDTLGDPFASVPEDRLEFARQRGIAVHAAMALLVRGKLDWKTVDPRIEGYVRAGERFERECPGKSMYVEKRMVIPEMELAGTPDVVRFIRGHRSLVDYKTGQQMTKRAKLQTAGYKKMHNFKFPYFPISKRFGLRLQVDSYYKLVEHDDPLDELAFDALHQEALAKQRANPWRLKYA